jgi:peptidoglycan-N-acetylglucosamine deacetylase
VERYPDLLRAISWAGNEVANHSYSHPNLSNLSAEEAKRELNQTKALINRVIQKPNLYFRPPGGQYNSRILSMAAQEGYRMILWNVFPKDHARPSPEKIYDRIMASAADGGVVLLHSGVEETLQVLPRVIKDLRAKGFQFLTVSEMLEENINPSVVSSWCFPNGPSAPQLAGRARHPLSAQASDPSRS